MSKQSEAVLKWRQLTKQRIIESMGGECCVCAYSRCNAALELHHVNPQEKELGIASALVSPRSWDSICDELRKCVLVCANCHREIHHDGVAVPDTARRFDESYADYKAVARTMRLSTCPVCSSEMRADAVTCSRRCSGLKRSRANWNRYDVVEMRKTMSLVEIGRVVGVSDKAVSKRLRKLGNG